MVTYANTIGGILQQWYDFGIFAYVLPFLMIFAVVYGILSKSRLLGENKGVNAVVALTVGLLALQFDYVANFFAIIFPYTGIGISILLVALIFFGLVANEAWAKWIWLVLGLIIFLVVVLTSLSDFSWWGPGYVWSDAWPAIISALILLGLVALVMFGDRFKK